MSRLRRTIAAFLIALTLFIYTHKPSDHEQVSESPAAKQAPQIEVNDVIDIAEVTQQIPNEPRKQKPKVYEYEATFYVATCEGCTGITASGYDVRQTQYYEGYRVIAADKSVPFGTIMRITLEDGTQFDGVVLDRGGAIKGARLDILVASKSEAFRLGRQRATVEILN